jgi:precorrin-6B methylase 2
MTELRLSDRLAAVVDALPLRPGMRILEIGGTPGTAAKAVARRIGDGHIVVIDRSAKGVAQIERNAAAEIAAGLLSVRHVAAEDLELLLGEPRFDLAFAIRVGPSTAGTRKPASAHASASPPLSPLLASC